MLRLHRSSGGRCETGERESSERDLDGDLEFTWLVYRGWRGERGEEGGQTYGHTPRYRAGCLIYFCGSVLNLQNSDQKSVFAQNVRLILSLYTLGRSHSHDVLFFLRKFQLLIGLQYQPNGR